MFDQTDITGQVLKTYIDKQPDKVYHHISPSSLGGCMRSHYLKLKGVKQTTPPGFAALVNFQIGRIWEEYMATVYKGSGRLVKWFQDGKDKPWVDKKLGFGGTPDMIVTDTDGEQIILDAKTVRSEWFQYQKKEVARNGFQGWVKNNSQYIYQQVCYMLLARQNGYPNMRKAVLSFASKNDGYVGLELEITLTTDLAKMVVNRIIRLKRYVDNNELQPCECEGWKVGYCDFGDPATRKPNREGKEVNTRCCDENLINKEA